MTFGRDLDTMACATTPLGADVEKLMPGQQITVPALHDRCYTVTPGDLLQNIAYAHGLSVSDVVAVPWNGFIFPPYKVVPRQRVLLPGARQDPALRPDRHVVSVMFDDWAHTDWRNWKYGDGKFIWPVVGPISQYAHDGHWALDIAVPESTPVKAADRGTVVMAGWSPVGYGFRVVIDHGNDYVTLYAHLRDIYVETGQVVGKGQTIGISGSNGNITGPHLHFETPRFRDVDRSTHFAAEVSISAHARRPERSAVAEVEGCFDAADGSDQTGGKMTTAIVMSGGGIRGPLQVGALQSLLEHGIKPDMVAGTSAGSLNAGFMAALGAELPTIPLLKKAWKSASKDKVYPGNILSVFARVLDGAEGFFPTEGMRKLIEKNLPKGVTTFGQCKLPCYLTAVDLCSAHLLVRRRSVGQASGWHDGQQHHSRAPAAALLPRPATGGWRGAG